jgi:outer membrane protein assembly factor BamB
MQASNLSYVYCPGCGYVAPATASFCVKCGASIVGAPPANIPAPASAPNGPAIQAPPLQTMSLDGGRYTDVKPLSDRGGMGLIFRARDTHLGQQECIIKQLRPDPDLDEAMFEREAALLARLRHPNLPACWDHFSENGAHYLVSDFIQGVALQDLIEQQGQASERDVVRWGIDLCDALVYIHSQQPPIVHRDIKPDNVIITPEGNAVLVDFGIARRYEAGRHDTMKMGTWGYLPPEQKAGHTEPRSDLYALGATLYFALTANDPQLLNIFDINLQWRKGVSFPPARDANPQVSVQMETILAQATQVLVEERYPSARAMLDDLRNLQAAQQSQPCPHCQAANPATAVRCRVCGKSLTLQAAPPQAAAPRPPQNWGSFRGSAARTGVTADSLRPPLKNLWSFQAQGPIDGSPIINDGVIYVGSRDHSLYALDAKQQRELWRYNAGAPLRSTPTLHGDTLFFGDDDGTLHAVQSSGGTARWRVPLRGKIFASAAAGAGLIISASQAGRIVALNPTSGETIWEHFDGSPFYASPAVLNNLVIVANGPGQVKGLDIASGKLLWTFQASGQVRATPACHDGLALLAGLDGSVTLLDVRTGERLWQRSLGAPISASPILTRDRAFAVGQEGAVFALSRDSGSRLWTTKTTGQLAASPILGGPTLLVIDSEGVVLLLDANTGKIGFQLALGAPVFASPAVSGRWCLIGTRQGNICLLEGQP